MSGLRVFLLVVAIVYIDVLLFIAYYIINLGLPFCLLVNIYCLCGLLKLNCKVKMKNVSDNYSNQFKLYFGDLVFIIFKK